MFSYDIRHTAASLQGLRQLPPHAQRSIEKALNVVARSAVSSEWSDDETVQFAGGIQVSGVWIAYTFDHDERELSILTVEADAETEANRPISVAA
jgi:hypothetical protein